MLRQIYLLFALLLVLTSCTTVPEQSKNQGLKIVDLTGQVGAIWEESARLPDAERIALFKSKAGPLLPGFYSHERMGLPDSTLYDQRLLQALKEYGSHRAGAEEVSRRFAIMLAPARTAFEHEFGRMHDYPPIYLLPSFGEFDGATRTLPEGVRLLFGADVIASLHLEHDIQPFFHHELFHLYHERFFEGCEKVWCGLWTEGLATYVAHRLNPGATDAELLLTIPVPLRQAVESDRRGAVCAALAKLDSIAAEDNAALFQGRRSGANRFPPRFGYYLGYLVAAEVGRTRSLRELARLRSEEVRPLVEKSLQSLASCA